MTLVRALAAALLSLLFPGIGHAVIRDWVRALFFAGLFIMALALTFSTDQLSALTSLEGATTVLTEDLTRIDQFFLSFLVLFAATDALLRGLGTVGQPSSHDGPSCPHCGRELDADLEFCHWCTAKLATPEDDEAVE